MSYSNNAGLSDDEGFRDRVLACCSEQALVYKDDTRYSIATFARAVIGSQRAALGLFELVCVSPGMGEVNSGASVDDPTILAAVQANWPTYAEVAYPEPTEPPAG